MNARFDLGAFLENAAPAWLKRVCAYRPRRRCPAVLPGGTQRCQLFRGHKGDLHRAGPLLTWSDLEPTAGHLRVQPEVQYCPCAGNCHHGHIPCSPVCIVHRLRRAGRD